MLQYALKRLLLMPPTFFLVSLVIFGVLNIAPGRPGESDQAAQAGESANSSTQRESYRIFKEQFNLDKPILLNTRPWLTRAEVRKLLVRAHEIGTTVSTAERLRAQNQLEDMGNYLVRHLIALLDDPNAHVQRWTAVHLTQAAQQRLVSDRAGDADAVRRRNRAIAHDNHAIADLKWDADATPAAAAQISSAWRQWWSVHRASFEYTAGEALRALFLDTRFAAYWSNLLHLDFGLSTVDRRPVLPVIVSKLKYSLSLTLLSVLLAYLIAVPIGIYSAVRQHTLGDATITVLLFVLYSLPTFFTGTVLLRLLSEGDPLAWFPTGGYETMGRGPQTVLTHLGDVAWHLVLPVATYTSVTLAALSRYARTGVIDVIRADYVRTARAKGLPELVVIIKHAARNGMIPILTLLGSLLPVLVSGSVVIEVIFNIPGMGLYLFDAINLRDYNAVMAVLVMATVLTLLGILVSDLSYAFADPRISFE